MGAPPAERTCAVFFDRSVEECCKRVATRRDHPTIAFGTGARAVQSFAQRLEVPAAGEAGFGKVVVVRDDDEARRLLCLWGAPTAEEAEIMVFNGAYDGEGVYFYQAYCREIADWALEHGRFGGPQFKPKRMTWIKPSLAWMMYRSGYGQKPGQERVLRVKLPHAAVAEILSRSRLSIHSSVGASGGRGGAKPSRRDGERGGANGGRVQWDPERDLFAVEPGKHEPRKLLRTRAIQIGMAGSLSEFYVAQVLSVEDVTELAHELREAHRQKSAVAIKAKMDALKSAGRLPDERPYVPQCPRAALARLGMAPGSAARKLAKLGRGKAAASS